MSARRAQNSPAATAPAATVVVAALLVLLVLLVLAVLASLLLGAYPTSPGQVLAWLRGDAPVVGVVILELRLPRTLLAMAAGAVLAAGGAALQALFRNPLAEPGVLGVSAGAAVGAALVSVLGVTAAVAPGAFVGAVAALLLVRMVARRAGGVDSAALLLAGIAVNAICLAGIGLLQYLADPGVLRAFTLWMLGSLAVPGEHLWLVLASCLLALVLLLRLAPALDALALGGPEARHLGFDARRVEWLVGLGLALGVGAATAVAGLLPFVGLLVPHLVRQAGFVLHRGLLPVSALAGAAFLLLADLVARLVLLPEELPVGVLTTLLGGPFFLWLLTRAGGRMGAR